MRVNVPVHGAADWTVPLAGTRLFRDRARGQDYVVALFYTEWFYYHLQLGGGVRAPKVLYA